MHASRRFRLSAIFAGAAVIAATLFPVLPAAAEEPPAPDPVVTSEPTADPTADPTSTPTPTADPTPEATATTEPAPASDPTPTADPTPTSTAAPGVETVSYSGTVQEFSDDGLQVTDGVALFGVNGQGYLRVDVSGLSPRPDALTPVLLSLEVPAGLALSADPDTRFAQLATASGRAALVAFSSNRVKQTVEKQTSSLVNQTPVASTTHHVFAVYVSPSDRKVKDAGQGNTAAAQALVNYADTYWSAQSDGSIHFALDGVVPWYQSTYSCKTDGGSTSLWSQALTKAKSKGYVPGKNMHLVLIFPNGGPNYSYCGNSIGLATIGGSVNQGGQAWVMGSTDDMARETIAHELGHNMSLGHADWLACPSSTPLVGAANADYAAPGITGCNVKYYGDVADVMGFGWGDGQSGALSSPQAIRAGIWPSSRWTTAPIGSSQTFTLYPVSDHTTVGVGWRSVVVQDRDGTAYFVELRNQSGDDSSNTMGCSTNYCALSEPNVRILRFEPSGLSGYPGEDTYLIGRSNSGVGYTSSNLGTMTLEGGDSIQVTAVSATQATIKVTRTDPATYATPDDDWVLLKRTLAYDSNLRVGDTWTLFLGDYWNQESYSFTWLRDGDPVGSTQNYTITAADIGHRIYGYVTPSGQPAVMPYGAPVNGYGPMVAGVYQPDQPGTVVIDNSSSPLHANVSGFLSSPLVSKYQWFRGSTAIAGATAADYTPTAADYGQKLKVRAYLTVTGYNPFTRDSAAKDYSIVVDTGSASLLGTGKVGTQLSLNNTLTYKTIDGPIAVASSYQWLRDGVAIGGATGTTYNLTASDYGKKVSLRIVASLAGWVSKTSTTAAVSVTQKGTFTSGDAPPVTATGLSLHVDTSLSAHIEPDADSISIQWYRNGVAVTGKTSATYVLTAADYGKKVTAKVTYKKLNYVSKVTESFTDATDTGEYWVESVSGAPVLSGPPNVGGTITVDSGRVFRDRLTGDTLASGDVVETIVWLRNGVVITTDPVKTDRDYTLTAADKGKVISARVTASTAASPYNYLLSNVMTVNTQVIGSDLLPGSDTAAPTIIKLLDKSDDFATVLSFTSTAGDGATGILRPAGTSIANTVKYQWYRDGVAIANATKSTYVLTTSDNGHGIKLRIVTSHGAVGSHTYTTDVRYTDEQDYSITIDPGHEPYQSTNTWTLGSQGGLYGVGQFQTPDGLITTPPIKIQWLRAGVPIPGATSDTYTIQAADYNKILSVRYIVGEIGYTPLMGVTPGQLIGKGVTLGSVDGYTDAEVDIEAGPGVGTLKAEVSGLYPPTPTPTYTYKWLRNGAVIPLATASTYKLVAADYDKPISVRVTMTRTNFVVPVTVLPDAVAVEPTIYQAVVPVAPTIDNMSPKVGQTVTASLPDPSFWDDSARTVPTTGITFVYTWYRSGSVISGATASSYTLVAADLGKKITVRVTATMAGRLGAATPVSAQTATVTAGTIDVGTYEPKTVINLSTRKASVSFVGTPVTTGFTKIYQWYRNGVKITGATASSFVLATTDTNKSISVLVRLTKTGYTTYWYQSIPGMLVNAITTPSGVVISGGNTPTTASLGQTLTCETPTYVEADGSMVGGHSGDSIAVQWLRGGSPISGQTTGSYLVVADDSGQTITCTVTVKAKLHKTYVDTSAPDMAVAP